VAVGVVPGDRPHPARYGQRKPVPSSEDLAEDGGARVVVIADSVEELTEAASES
jgi:hypothetical protein